MPTASTNHGRLGRGKREETAEIRDRREQSRDSASEASVAPVAGLQGLSESTAINCNAGCGSSGATNSIERRQDGGAKLATCFGRKTIILSLLD